MSALPPDGKCPKCGAEWEQFMPLQVARDMFSPWRALLALFGHDRPAYALICRACKCIVGYEGSSKGGWVYEWDALRAGEGDVTELEKAVERLTNEVGLYPHSDDGVGELLADLRLILARLAALEREVKAWRERPGDYAAPEVWEPWEAEVDAARAATDEVGK